MNNKSLIIEKPFHENIIDQGIPEITDTEILVKVKTSGICGTDLHIYEGNYMGAYPVIPGHEFSGIVEQTGPHVTRIKKGDHVAIEPNIACNNCMFCLQNKLMPVTSEQKISAMILILLKINLLILLSMLPVLYR